MNLIYAKKFDLLIEANRHIRKCPNSGDRDIIKSCRETQTITKKYIISQQMFSSFKSTSLKFYDYIRYSFLQRRDE